MFHSQSHMEGWVHSDTSDLLNHPRYEREWQRCLPYPNIQCLPEQLLRGAWRHV
nr:MAG TPA: hypothetical protein [Bacteriophage sp.]